MPGRAWCKSAEVGLLSVYKAAGGPCPQGDQPFLGRGTAVIRTRLVGGRAPGRLHRSAGADEVDTANCHVFVNASLAPVILFRRRLSLGWRGAQWYLEKWPFYCEVAGFDAPVGGCVQTGLHRLHEDCGSLEGLASPRSSWGFINGFFGAIDEL